MSLPTIPSRRSMRRRCIGIVWSTVHSNSAKDTLLRLENMTARVSQNPQQATIGQAVNLIVYLKYTGNRRIVEDIIEVEGYDVARKEYRLKKLV